jgi:thymidylate synthase
MRVFDNIHEAYKGVLLEVYSKPEYECAPRGLPIREITNFMFKVNNPSSESLITDDSKRNEVMAKYLVKENELYNSCTNKAEDYAQASPFWKTIANPDGTINSAYGYLIWTNRSTGSDKFEGVMRTPWEWAKLSLESDADTRQAILRFSLPEHQWVGNKDQVCTLQGVFNIRDSKLNLAITMRSNDVCVGLGYDLSFFCSLLDKMILDLRHKYPNLQKGSYTHIAHSMHMYMKDEDKIKKMIASQL